MGLEVKIIKYHHKAIRVALFTKQKLGDGATNAVDLVKQLFLRLNLMPIENSLIFSTAPNSGGMDAPLSEKGFNKLKKYIVQKKPLHFGIVYGTNDNVQFTSNFEQYVIDKAPDIEIRGRFQVENDTISPKCDSLEITFKESIIEQFVLEMMEWFKETAKTINACYGFIGYVAGPNVSSELTDFERLFNIQYHEYSAHFHDNIRDVFWANYLSEEHIKKLGGFDAIKDDAPFAHIEDLSTPGKPAILLSGSDSVYHSTVPLKAKEYLSKLKYSKATIFDMANGPTLFNSQKANSSMGQVYYTQEELNGISGLDSDTRQSWTEEYHELYKSRIKTVSKPNIENQFVLIRTKIDRLLENDGTDVYDRESIDELAKKMSPQIKAIIDATTPDEFTYDEKTELAHMALGYFEENLFL